MGLNRLMGWNTEYSQNAGAACGTACGSAKPDDKPSACGASKPDEKPSACGSACGAGK